jgi:flagellar basal-body rod protein FlgB
VEPIHLFDLASSQARWLAIKQATIAGNVANANTPGFQARDIEPFDKVLGSTEGALAVTSPRHIATDAAEQRTTRVRKTDSWDVVHSGNSVSVEQEMLKAGDVSRDYSLNTAIVKTFHRMLTSAAK